MTLTIDHLPNELLREALLEVVKDDCRTVGCKALKLKTSARSLPLVCHRWRNVVKSCGQFYITEVVLSGGGEYKEVTTKARRKASQAQKDSSSRVERSDLHVFVAHSSRDFKEYGDANGIVPALRQLMTQSHRILDVRAHISVDAVGARLLSALGERNSFARMLHFCLRLDRYKGSTIPSDVVVDLSLASNLRSISIQDAKNIEAFRFPSNLVTLRLYRCGDPDNPTSWGTLSALLQSAKHVEDVAISPLFLDAESTNPVIELPFLQKLLLRADMRTVQALVPRLKAPGLRTAAMAVYPGPVTDNNTVPVSNRLFSALQHLSLEVSGWAQEVELLLPLPSRLTSLQLTIHYHAQPFNDTLAVSPKSQLPASLTKLEVVFQEPRPDWWGLFLRLDLSFVEVLGIVTRSDGADGPDDHFPSTEGAMIPLPSLQKLKLEGHWPPATEALCRCIEAPSLRELHIKRKSPFPRSNPDEAAPTLYSSPTDVVLTLAVQRREAFGENPLALFPNTETLILLVDMASTWDISEALRGCLLDVAELVVLPRLRRFTVRFTKKDNPAEDAAEDVYPLTVLLEQLFTKRRDAGVGLERVALEDVDGKTVLWEKGSELGLDAGETDALSLTQTL